MAEQTFHTRLKEKVNQFAHSAYRVTRFFPKEEMYGLTSQLRRAAVSVALNYVEGFARGSRNELRRFLEISFGSLKESRFLIEFSYEEGYLSDEDHTILINQADAIGAMIWGTLTNLRSHE